MAEEYPVGLCHQPHKVPLYFLRIGLIAEAQAVGETLDMGVHHDAACLSKSRPEDDVGGLARHAPKLEKLLHGIRHTAPVLHDQSLGRLLDGPGLGPIKTSGTN